MMFFKYCIQTLIVITNMKNTLLLLSLLVIGTSTYAQQSRQNEFKGNWTSSEGSDGGIAMNFKDSNKIHFTLGNTFSWNGDYKYRTSKIKNDIVMMLWPYDKMRKDSLQIVITDLTEDSFQLKSIMHYYSDGRPPESELLNDHIYIKKGKK
jgi:hypothetical protein